MHIREVKRQHVGEADTSARARRKGGGHCSPKLPRSAPRASALPGLGQSGLAEPSALHITRIPQDMEIRHIWVSALFGGYASWWAQGKQKGTPTPLWGSTSLADIWEIRNRNSEPICFPTNRAHRKRWSFFGTQFLESSSCFCTGSTRLTFVVPWSKDIAENSQVSHKQKVLEGCAELKASREHQGPTCHLPELSGALSGKKRQAIKGENLKSGCRPATGSCRVHKPLVNFILGGGPF